MSHWSNIFPMSWNSLCIYLEAAAVAHGSCYATIIIIPLWGTSFKHRTHNQPLRCAHHLAAPIRPIELPNENWWRENRTLNRNWRDENKWINGCDGLLARAHWQKGAPAIVLFNRPSGVWCDIGVSKGWFHGECLGGRSQRRPISVVSDNSMRADCVRKLCRWIF